MKHGALAVITGYKFHLKSLGIASLKNALPLLRDAVFDLFQLRILTLALSQTNQ